MIATKYELRLTFFFNTAALNVACSLFILIFHGVTACDGIAVQFKYCGVLFKPVLAVEMLWQFFCFVFLKYKN